MSRRALACLAFLVGSVAAGGETWTRTKGLVAEHLIDAAFARAVERGGNASPPWPGADFEPVAEIRLPRLDVRARVLRGAQGATLAFGPGWVPGTAPLRGLSPVNRRSMGRGTFMPSVIGGHRDREFSFLDELIPGEGLTLEVPGEPPSEWTLESCGVTHHRDGSVVSPRSAPRLILLTCYPVRERRPTDRRWITVWKPTEPA